jgi:hypothetical protein
MSSHTRYASLIVNTKPSVSHLSHTIFGSLQPTDRSPTQIRQQILIGMMYLNRSQLAVRSMRSDLHLRSASTIERSSPAQPLYFGSRRLDLTLVVRRQTSIHSPSDSSILTDIMDIVHYRELNWIGKTARMKESTAPRRLIASWCDNPRKPGRPQTTYRNSYTDAIKKVIPDLPQDGKLQEWMPIAKEEQAFGTPLSAHDGGRPSHRTSDRPRRRTDAEIPFLLSFFSPRASLSLSFLSHLFYSQTTTDE